MCGIAAEFHANGHAAPADLALLRHRGPDSEGQWLTEDGRVWLGHTRLAILDLSSSGAQPMHDPLTGNVIVFNGEIYNHRELRFRLVPHRPAWRGSSDTETVLAGYRLWGRNVLKRLKGMFAFALYDAPARSLLLARDRLGIKPLYYTWRDGRLRAASEVRVLLDKNPCAVSPRAISAYLQWGACPEDCLIFPEVKSLPAGHSLWMTPDGEMELEPYWPPQKLALPNMTVTPWGVPLEIATECPKEIHSLSTSKGGEGRGEEALSAPRALRRFLERSVREHLLADVPVASFLSGGIDSSVLTALAARQYGRRLATFSVGFANRAFDETSIAAQVATRYGTDHHRVEVSVAESCELVREAVEKMDLPSVDAINTYIVARKVAEQGIKVALSGLGGDELFGGYPSFRDVPRLKWVAQWPRWLRRRLGWFGATGRRLADLPAGDLTALTLWRRRFWTDQMLREAGLPLINTQPEASPELPDDFARMSWAELTGYMRHLLLRDADQMSMAVSLELRVPFLDHKLVEFVLSLPAREKTRYGQGKRLLVEACRDLLPAAVYQRRKMGFGLPMTEWMRGPLASFVCDGLDGVAERGLVPARVLDDQQCAFAARRLHWTRLWSLVVLGHYVRRIQGRMPVASTAVKDVALGQYADAGS